MKTKGRKDGLGVGVVRGRDLAAKLTAAGAGKPVFQAKVTDIFYDQSGGLGNRMEKKDKLAQKPDDIVEAKDTVSVAKGVVDDHADIQNAQAESQEQPSYKHKSLLRIGPGLITGVADDDPSGIGTYSVAGAQFGYQPLWLAPVCIPLMIAVQEMCGRLGLVTSKGLSAIIKEY